jgi:hypothetical protein
VRQLLERPPHLNPIVSHSNPRIVQGGIMATLADSLEDFKCGDE